MNSLNFTGGLGRDSEMRYLPNGDPVLSFSVALSSGYGDKRITTWLNCSMFGKRAESVEPYLKKGAQVAISGEFTARPYQTKDGAEKLSLDVRVNDLTLIGGKQYNQQSNETKKTDQKQNNPADFDDLEDDLPF